VCSSKFLRSDTEVKPLVASLYRRLEVLFFPLIGHGIPGFVAFAIGLSAKSQHNIEEVSRFGSLVDPNVEMFEE
jgi:hypothetical protein